MHLWNIPRVRVIREKISREIAEQRSTVSLEHEAHLSQILNYVFVDKGGNIFPRDDSSLHKATSVNVYLHKCVHQGPEADFL